MILVAAGICGICGGWMSRLSGNAEHLPTKLHTVESADFLLHAYNVKYECEGYDAWAVRSPGLHLLADPNVVGIYHDHGIDLTQVPYWELDWCVGTERTTVLSEDPHRVRVSISVADEELRVTLDGSLASSKPTAVPA